MTATTAEQIPTQKQQLTSLLRTCISVTLEQLCYAVPSHDAIFAARCLAGISFLLSLTGCQSTGPRLTAEQEQIREELATISPADDALTHESPIIDINTHTFNARYLPLKGVLLGKRDAFPPITWLISDSCAETLAHALVERTELAPAAGSPGVTRRELQSQAHEHRDQGIVCGIFLGLLDKAATRGCWSKGKSPSEQLAALDKVADEMSLPQRMAVMAAAHMMGMEEQVRAKEMKTDGMRGIPGGEN